jgi:hypothetical protein
MYMINTVEGDITRASLGGVFLGNAVLDLIFSLVLTARQVFHSREYGSETSCTSFHEHVSIEWV